jgi:hypothetical protein
MTQNYTPGKLQQEVRQGQEEVGRWHHGLQVAGQDQGQGKAARQADGLDYLSYAESVCSSCRPGTADEHCARLDLGRRCLGRHGSPARRQHGPLRPGAAGSEIKRSSCFRSSHVTWPRWYSQNEKKSNEPPPIKQSCLTLEQKLVGHVLNESPLAVSRTRAAGSY